MRKACLELLAVISIGLAAASPARAAEPVPPRPMVQPGGGSAAPS